MALRRSRRDPRIVLRLTPSSTSELHFSTEPKPHGAPAAVGPAGAEKRNSAAATGEGAAASSTPRWSRSARDGADSRSMENGRVVKVERLAQDMVYMRDDSARMLVLDAGENATTKGARSVCSDIPTNGAKSPAGSLRRNQLSRISSRCSAVKRGRAVSTGRRRAVRVDRQSSEPRAACQSRVRSIPTGRQARMASRRARVSPKARRILSPRGGMK